MSTKQNTEADIEGDIGFENSMSLKWPRLIVEIVLRAELLFIYLVSYKKKVVKAFIILKFSKSLQL